MDVLNAELKWIENRCYRLLRVQDNISYEEEEEKEIPTSEVNQDDEYDPDLPILHEGNEFYVTIPVPVQVIKYMTYKRGLQAELQQHGAKVNIPQDKNTRNKIITITGATKKIVSDTYRRIESIVNTTRFKKTPTHFISLPMNSKEIKDSFLKFKNDVLEKYRGINRLDENLFQNPNKLHVTITPLILLDERDTQNAIAHLKKCMDNILTIVGTKEFVVHVKGIEYMNDDPAEVDVLYAKLKELDDDNRLQIIADSIMKEFVESNFAKPQHDRVKLHITIMNTLRRTGDDSPRITFDARGILKDFKDYDFGKIVLSELHLSAMNSTAVSDKYYVATHKIKLNV